MRCVWLDTLKGWGILFIVLGHIVGAGSHLASPDYRGIFDAAYKYFYAFHVPLFFCAAGMTFRTKTWREFFCAKWRRLLVPYFFWGLVSIFIYYFVSDVAGELFRGADRTGYYAGKTEPLSLSKALVNLVLGGWWPLGFTANSVLWFIPALFALECVSQGIARAVRSMWGWWLVAGAAWVLTVFACLPSPLPLGLGGVPKFLPYFVLGMSIGTKKGPMPERRFVWGGIGVALVVGFGVLAVLNPWQYFPHGIVQHMACFALTAGNIMAWLLVSQAFPLRSIAQCGIWSLGIMLLHKFPVVLLQNAFPPIRGLFAETLPLALFGTITVFVFAVVVSCLLCWGCLRWVPEALGGIRQKRPQ